MMAMKELKIEPWTTRRCFPSTKSFCWVNQLGAEHLLRLSDSDHFPARLCMKFIAYKLHS